MKFSSTSNTSVQRYLYSLFQNQRPHLSLLHLFRRISQLLCQDQQNSKRTRIHSLIFLWTLKGFISPEYFLNFFLDLYISPWLRKSFKFMVLRLLENTFVSQKNESVHFYSWPQSKLSPRFL